MAVLTKEGGGGGGGARKPKLNTIRGKKSAKFAIGKIKR